MGSPIFTVQEACIMLGIAHQDWRDLGFDDNAPSLIPWSKVLTVAFSIALREKRIDHSLLLEKLAQAPGSNEIYHSHIVLIQGSIEWFRSDSHLGQLIRSKGHGSFLVIPNPCFKLQRAAVTSLLIGFDRFNEVVSVEVGTPVDRVLALPNDDNLLGEGILSWPRSERVSDRYGTVNLSLSPTRNLGCDACLVTLIADRFIGMQGVLSAEVIEAFDSKEDGAPEPGDILFLGEGQLFKGEFESIGVEPSEVTEGMAWLNVSNLYFIRNAIVALRFHPTDDSYDCLFCWWLTDGDQVFARKEMTSQEASMRTAKDDESEFGVEPKDKPIFWTRTHISEE